MTIKLSDEIAELFIRSVWRKNEVMALLDIVGKEEREGWEGIWKMYPKEDLLGASIKCDHEKNTAELVMPFKEDKADEVVPDHRA